MNARNLFRWCEEISEWRTEKFERIQMTKRYGRDYLGGLWLGEVGWMRLAWYSARGFGQGLDDWGQRICVWTRGSCRLDRSTSIRSSEWLTLAQYSRCTINWFIFDTRATLNISSLLRGRWQIELAVVDGWMAKKNWLAAQWRSSWVRSFSRRRTTGQLANSFVKSRSIGGGIWCSIW